MWPASIPLELAARVFGVVMIAGALWWAVDAIGDAREARVHQQYDAAIRKINDQIDTQLTIDEKMSAVAESMRQRALQNALALPSIAPTCPASQLQADRLNAIR